ncbi:LuxR C-terminal-related transcriptional regulator [Pseudomonas sp. SIMBA_077]
MSNPSSSNAASTWCWIGKLTPPHTLLTSKVRETLLTSLHQHPARPLLLVVAPAGYGKTILLMQWRQALMAQSDAAHHAWLSLDEADADPNRFLAYLILAFERAGLALGHLSHLAATQTLDAQPLRTLTALIHALSQAERPITLLLDDYHSVTSKEVDHLICTLLEHATPGLRLVVASRTRPAWPLARWKTNGWVQEVDAHALSLSEEQTHSILGAQVDVGDVQHIHRATEGWAVAVQLARLWRESHEGHVYGLGAFSGCVTDVADYLAEQVLGSLSAPLQLFLLETSLLERFNAELADAVRQRTDSAQLLSQLSHLETLLMPLDAERQWFRCHGLLRDFLASRVSPPQARRIHCAAAQWLAQANDWVQAVAHALRAKDTALAIHLIVQAGGWALILRHGIRYAQSLVQQFDEQTRRSAPDLLLLQAYLHAKLGEHALCTQRLELAQQSLREEPRLLRDFYVIRTLSNAYLDHFQHEAAPQGLPPYVHPEALLAQATLECVNTLHLLTRGEVSSALHSIRAAQVQMHLVASPRGESYCSIHQAQLLALCGQMQASHALIESTLAFVHNHFGGESTLKALVGCLKSRQLYWQGDWPQATALLKDGWAALEYADGWLEVVAGTAEVTWRTTLRTKGLQPALLELEHVSRLAHTRNWPRLQQLINAWRVDALVQGGQLTQARTEALQTNLEGQADHPQDWRNQEAACLALGRLQIATGAAHAALNRLQRDATQLQNKGLLLPSWRLTLLALVARHKAHIAQQTDDALATLTALCDHAIPGLLLEVGPSLLPVLEQYIAALPVLQPVITRLRGWRAHPLRAKISFSTKELHVLNLLAGGQSNKAMAQALDVSENTVKFHLKNIYSKLSVDNRTRAIRMALRQGLIGTS